MNHDSSRPDAPMDMVFLHGLELPCRVGCTDEERMTPQSLRVDVEFYCASLERAGRDDDIHATVDYRIATQMIAAVQDAEFLLIERVAEVLADIALTQAAVQQVKVRLYKRPPVQGLEGAGVQIVRSRG